MPPTPYYFQVSHGPPTRLRLLMNGVPFYRCVPETEGTTHGAAAAREPPTARTRH